MRHLFNPNSGKKEKEGFQSNSLLGIFKTIFIKIINCILFHKKQSSLKMVFRPLQMFPLDSLWSRDFCERESTTSESANATSRPVV